MENKLIAALLATSRTMNGARQYESTGDACLDLFSSIGAARNNSGIFGLFKQALNSDRELAIRILLWAHDVREGAGERKTFIELLVNHTNNKDISEEEALGIIKLIPEIGRWKTLVFLLLSLQSSQLQVEILKLISTALLSGDKLCAKWVPRQGFIAERLRNFINKNYKMRLSRQAFRKLLVTNSCTIEQKMSSKDWDSIELEKVPSKAMLKYSKALRQHLGGKFQDFLTNVNNGKEHMHMHVAFPHEIVHHFISASNATSAYYSESDLAVDAEVEDFCQAAWSSLKMIPISKNILPMVDVSGSMFAPISKNSGTRAIEAAVSIGIWLAENNEGMFNNTLITFSERPELIRLQGTIGNKITQVMRDVGFNTDFRAAYLHILEAAVRNNLKQEELPDTLLVISDMSFDYPESEKTLFEDIEQEYAKAGYKRPSLVFWDVMDYPGYAATDYNSDVALISGYSTNIVNTLFSGESDLEVKTPRDIMLDAVMIERYNYKEG